MVDTYKMFNGWWDEFLELPSEEAGILNTAMFALAFQGKTTEFEQGSILRSPYRYMSRELTNQKK